jgi:hypothetical protein
LDFRFLREPVFSVRMSLDIESQKRLAELEGEWNAKFIVGQPKLPSEALLTGAVSMALAFGGVLFALSLSMRPYAWIWFALSGLCGLINRFLARRWYTRVVLPWDKARRTTIAEIQALRQKRDAVES